MRLKARHWPLLAINMATKRLWDFTHKTCVMSSKHVLVQDGRFSVPRVGFSFVQCYFSACLVCSEGVATPVASLASAGASHRVRHEMFSHQASIYCVRSARTRSQRAAWRPCGQESFSFVQPNEGSEALPAVWTAALFDFSEAT